MRITYDSRADMAYIYLQKIATGAAKRSIELNTEGRTHRSRELRLVLDLNKAGQIIGIEVFDAKRSLPPEVIKSAEPLDA